MRRRWLPALMMLLCLLTACGKQQKDGMQQALDSRAALLKAGGCQFTAQLRANVGERVFDVTLRCQSHCDGDLQMTVLAPQSIEGVTLTVNQSTGKLCFDDVMLDLGFLSGTELSPAEAPALIVRYWESAYIDSAGWEDVLLHVCLKDDADESAPMVHLWLDENLLPQKAEVVQGKDVVAAVEFEDVMLNGG